MTSLERKEARYWRRRSAREMKKKRDYGRCDDFEKVFSYKNLYTAYRKCRSGVMWKGSVQRYVTTAPLRVYETRQQLLSGKYRSAGFQEFDIMERGKPRHIRAVNIGERVVQRCLCDNCLVPLLSRSFIYDNGASLRNKGYHFAARRLKTHLQKYYRQYGTDGYILLFDFSKYFDNISHEQIRQILRKAVTDPRILALTNHFIDMFGEVGVGLGSQVSQIFALAAGNGLDHFVKEKLGIRYYGRYMDDGYLLHRDKGYLQKCLLEIREFCRLVGIKLNERKTMIVKVSHGFVWLKGRYYLLDSGKVIRKLPKGATGKQRKKLRKLISMGYLGILTPMDIWQSYQSWRSYGVLFTSRRSIAEMDLLYFQKMEGLCNGSNENAFI